MSPGISHTTLIGAAAEHYVMSQLLRRQIIAALAPAGVPDTDIIISDALGCTFAGIQVKARRNIGRDGGWHMHAKHEEIKRPRLFYCFVDFGNDICGLPACWIAPSAVVANVLKVSHKAWLDKPGRGGKSHTDHAMRRLLPNYDHLGLKKYRKGWLDSYSENWDQLTKQ